MNRLGGWWRLWIALSVPLFIASVVSYWPSALDDKLAVFDEKIPLERVDDEIASTRKGNKWKLDGPDGKAYLVIAPPHLTDEDM